MGVPLGMPRGARCIQRFDDSLNSAIHITYCILLHSSLMQEPRDPLLKVVFIASHCKNILHCIKRVFVWKHKPSSLKQAKEQDAHNDAQMGEMDMCESTWACTTKHQWQPLHPQLYDNDPFIGSPMETLLQLLLPLNDQVWPTSWQWGVVTDSPKPIQRSH